MVVLFIVFAFGLGMIGLAARANAHFRQESTLPMQWSLSGTVNWSAPRLVALSPIPALGIICLTVVGIRGMNQHPGPAGPIPSLVIFGIILVAVDVLHLWLAEKTVRRNVG